MNEKEKKICPKCKAVHYGNENLFCICGGLLETALGDVFGTDSPFDEILRKFYSNGN